jgi:hypothetical protein
VVLVLESLRSKETVQSRLLHYEENWHETDADFLFTAWGQCNHTLCKEDFAIAGIGGLEPGYDQEDGSESWDKFFIPKFCDPMPDMIELPSKCPEDVQKSLRASFPLFLMNRAACAGRIRVALEQLMTHLGVPKRKKSTKGKYYYVDLHKRIELFAQKDATIGGHLMALKWVGNTGSHDNTVSKDDLLNAFEVLEHALIEIIERRTDNVTQLAKQLTKIHRRRR